MELECHGAGCCLALDSLREYPRSNDVSGERELGKITQLLERAWLHSWQSLCYVSPLKSAAILGPASPNTSDTKDTELAARLWEEWKYRHQLYWSRLLKYSGLLGFIFLLPAVNYEEGIFGVTIEHRMVERIGRPALEAMIEVLGLMLTAVFALLLFGEGRRFLQVNHQYRAAMGSGNESLRVSFELLSFEAILTWMFAAVFFAIGLTMLGGPMILSPLLIGASVVFALSMLPSVASWLTTPMTRCSKCNGQGHE